MVHVGLDSNGRVLGVAFISFQIPRVYGVGLSLYGSGKWGVVREICDMKKRAFIVIIACTNSIVIARGRME